LKANININNT